MPKKTVQSTALHPILKWEVRDERENIVARFQTQADADKYVRTDVLPAGMYRSDGFPQNQYG